MERKLISIEGTVFNDNGDITEEEFLDAFYEFLEDKGWYFGGLTREEVASFCTDYLGLDLYPYQTTMIKMLDKLKNINLFNLK